MHNRSTSLANQRCAACLLHVFCLKQQKKGFS